MVTIQVFAVCMHVQRVQFRRVIHRHIADKHLLTAVCQLHRIGKQRVQIAVQCRLKTGIQPVQLCPERQRAKGEIHRIAAPHGQGQVEVQPVHQQLLISHACICQPQLVNVHAQRERRRVRLEHIQQILAIQRRVIHRLDIHVWALQFHLCQVQPLIPQQQWVEMNMHVFHKCQRISLLVTHIHAVYGQSVQRLVV